MGDDESNVPDGVADDTTEIDETREYLAQVEQELAIREETLEANLREQEELKRCLQTVNLERGLRRGRVDQLQAIDTYRREVTRQLKRLQSKAEVLSADVRRAKERRAVVLEELDELAGKKL
jgi:chromosome segregation ATPase